jgi:hypothetical protein
MIDEDKMGDICRRHRVGGNFINNLIAILNNRDRTVEMRLTEIIKKVD